MFVVMFRQTERAARTDAHQRHQLGLGDDRVEQTAGRRRSGHIVVPGGKVQRGKNDLVKSGRRRSRFVGVQRAKTTRGRRVHVQGLRPERRRGLGVFGKRICHRQMSIP